MIPRVIDETRLLEHLDSLGWEVERASGDTFKSTHAAEGGKLDVFLRLHENWLIASVVPFLSTKGDNPFALSRWLLRMNRDMPMSKFAYDEDGDVVLTVELPTENLDPGEIREALEGLLTSAREHRATLREAAKSLD